MCTAGPKGGGRRGKASTRAQRPKPEPATDAGSLSAACHRVEVQQRLPHKQGWPGFLHLFGGWWVG